MDIFTSRQRVHCPSLPKWNPVFTADFIVRHFATIMHIKGRYMKHLNHRNLDSLLFLIKFIQNLIVVTEYIQLYSHVPAPSVKVHVVLTSQKKTNSDDRYRDYFLLFTMASHLKQFTSIYPFKLYLATLSYYWTEVQIKHSQYTIQNLLSVQTLMTTQKMVQNNQRYVQTAKTHWAEYIHDILVPSTGEPKLLVCTCDLFLYNSFSF